MTDRETYEANGVKLYVEDDMIIRSIPKNGPFEPETTAWIFDKISEKTFVDVGVSTGWFSCAVAARGTPVFGFEPLPNSYRRCIENLELNDLTMTLVNAAVSDFIGTASFQYNSRLPLTSGASLLKNIGGNRASMEVDVVRLDDFDIPSIGVMKVDVEGNEMAVLRGAKQTIAKHRPHMVLEANNGDFMAKLAAWMEENDYTWVQADRRNMLCTPKPLS